MKQNMKTILFPTDFSNNATHASAYSGMIAKRMNANVVLLNVYTIPTISEYQLPTEIENFINQKRKDALSKLEEFSKTFLKNTGLQPERVSTRVEYGYVSEKIVDTSRALQADLIVMGTKGASDFLDRWLGTNAQKVMKHSDCPVWIVPQKASTHYPKYFLYAADFQEDELFATHKVMEFAEPFGANCKVVHIHDYFEMNVGHRIEETSHELQAEFEQEEMSIKSLNRANIIEGLETYIHTHKPDVLVLAMHDKSFLSGLFETSVSKYFVQNAHLPILTFRK
jgi:nucleotide-binding universal stress UspA family protein